MMQVKCKKCSALGYSAASIVRCKCGGICFSTDAAYNNGVKKDKNIVREKTNGGK